MKRIHLFLATVACLGLGSLSFGQFYPDQEARAGHSSQRTETPPRWAIGNWVGRNDFRKSDVDLQIGDDGRVTITFRTGTNVQLNRGFYRSGNLEIAGDRFSVRQRGSDIEIVRDNERRDYSLLHRVGIVPEPPRQNSSLTIDYPRENDRMKRGSVTFKGRSDGGQVEVVIYRDGREVRKLAVQPRRGEFEVRTNLEEGRHEAYFSTKWRNTVQAERRVRFTVIEGRTRIERPDSRDRLRPGIIRIEGSSDSDEVEVEITRGFDRVFVERVPVRNGSFVSSPRLEFGQYVVKVQGISGKEVVSSDKQGFTVDGRGNDDDRTDLKLDRPFDRQQITDGSVKIEGSSNAREVRVVIMRGREKVQERTISVRNGRFGTSLSLQPGRYEALVSVRGSGREVTERRVSFSVGR